MAGPQRKSSPHWKEHEVGALVQLYAALRETTRSRQLTQANFGAILASALNKQGAGSERDAQQVITKLRNLAKDLETVREECLAANKILAPFSVWFRRYALILLYFGLTPVSFDCP